MQYNIHLPYYNETFLYGYGFGIRYERDALLINRKGHAPLHV